MQTASLHEGVAFDPGQNLAAPFVEPLPARCCIEAHSLQVQKDVADS